MNAMGDINSKLSIGNATLVALGAYILIAFIFTLPTGLRLGDYVAGSGGDPWQTMWRFEHKSQELQQATQNNHVAQYVTQEFLGQSEPQLVNLSVWPWMPLQWLFGQPVGYNLVWLLSFILSGIGMYALVLQIMRLSNMKEEMPHTAAFIAGIAYMLLPFHVAHSFGHFGAMQMQWLPLIMALALSFYTKPTALKSIGIGLLLIIQAWSEHHYMLWLAIITLVALPVFWKQIVPFLRNPRVAIYVGITLLVSGAIITASYLPTIQLAFTPSSSLELGQEQLIRFSADPFAYIVPPAFHAIWGGLFDQIYTEPGGFTGNVSESTQFLGYVVLLFVAFFHQKIPKRAKWALLTFGAVFFVISLGPKLHLFGTVTSLPLPYGLIDEIPGLSAVRAVARAGVVVGLVVTTLFGLALATQLHRRGSAIAIATLIILEFLFIPMAAQSTELSSAYDVIKQLPGTAILEVPAATNYTIASRALFASNYHGKEVVGNIALERALSEEDFLLAKQLPGVRQLLLLRTTDIRENRPEFFEQDLADSLLDSMELLNTYAIVIHTDSLSVLQRAAVETYLEDRVKLTRSSIEDVDTYLRDESQVGDGVLLMRRDGWENIGFDQGRDSVFAEIPDVATAVIHNLRTETLPVRITFTLPPENRGAGEILLNGELVQSFTADQQTVTAEVSLQPGEHILTIKTTTSDRLIIQNPALRRL